MNEFTCFTCGYDGPDCNEDEDGNECCPDCGTIAGDGFGMKANDPRYRESPHPAAPPVQR